METDGAYVGECAIFAAARGGFWVCSQPLLLCTVCMDLYVWMDGSRRPSNQVKGARCSL